MICLFLLVIQVIKAETRMCMLLAENNIPLSFSDKLNKIIPDLFPDSNIAKQYKMGPMKTTCILNEALAPNFLKGTIEAMKAGVYSLSTDGSNDTDLEKMNPLTVRLYDVNTSRVVTNFIGMCCTAGPTGGQAASIFNKIDEVLKTHKVPWGNCVGFSVDNTSTNLGKRNSIKTRVLAENQECYFLGCPFHIIHNTAHKGSSAFTKVTGFDVEDFCIDLYYFFDKISKRKSILESYCKFCDQEY